MTMIWLPSDCFALAVKQSSRERFVFQRVFLAPSLDRMKYARYQSPCRLQQDSVLKKGICSPFRWSVVIKD